MAYVIAVQIFDTLADASPPPPSPGNDQLAATALMEPVSLTSNRIRHGWSTKSLDAQKYHLRQTVLPYPFPQWDGRPVLLHVDPLSAIGHSGCK